jgi:hypothetical protein
VCIGKHSRRGHTFEVQVGIPKEDSVPVIFTFLVPSFFCQFSNTTSTLAVKISSVGFCQAYFFEDFIPNQTVFETKKPLVGVHAWTVPD